MRSPHPCALLKPVAAPSSGRLQVNRVPIGNIGDLRTVTVKEVGGVPVTELQKSIKGLRGGR